MFINLNIEESLNIELINHINGMNNDDTNKFINLVLELGYKTYDHINKNSNIYNKTNINCNDELILNKIDRTINFNNDKIIKVINEIKDNTNNISHLFNKSSIKGVYGENLLSELLSNYFPDNILTNMASTPHSGDFHLFDPDINKTILIESKFYTNTIDQKEINKLYYDMDHTGINYSIFISLSSSISNKKNDIEWEINNDKIMIFLSNVLDNNKYIIVGMMLLKTLISFNENKNNINIQNFSDNSYKKILEKVSSMNCLKLQINKIKNNILNIHSSTSTHILDLYNSVTTLDNNFNQSIDLLQNSLTDEFNSIKSIINVEDSVYNINHIYNMIETISNDNIKKILNTVISDLYFKNFVINKKWIILKNNLEFGKIIILKNSININLKNNLVLKNIKNENWNNIMLML